MIKNLKIIIFFFIKCPSLCQMNKNTYCDKYMKKSNDLGKFCLLAGKDRSITEWMNGWRQEMTEMESKYIWKHLQVSMTCMIFFLGAFLLVTLLTFREKCFLAFSPSKNRKSPDFLGSFKSYERKLFCVKISKKSDDFWPFFITRDFWGTFGTFWPFLAKNGYFLSKDLVYPNLL